MAKLPDAVSVKIIPDFGSIKDTAGVLGVLLEVGQEIARARGLHGKQADYDLGFDSQESVLEELRMETASGDLTELLNGAFEFYAKRLCQNAHKASVGTWAYILLEEYAELVAANTLEEQRAEAIQLAAMAASVAQIISEKIAVEAAK